MVVRDFPLPSAQRSCTLQTTMHLINLMTSGDPVKGDRGAARSGNQGDPPHPGISSPVTMTNLTALQCHCPVTPHTHVRRLCKQHGGAARGHQEVAADPLPHKQALLVKFYLYVDLS